jgi:hydrogenase-4 component E
MTYGSGVEAVLALMVITDLLLLGSSRLKSCVTIAAAQGVVVSLLPLFLAGGEGPLRALFLSGGGVAIKGVVFPWLLLRVLREANVRREVEPFVGHTLSVLAGTGCLIFALWVEARLALSDSLPGGSTLTVAVGLATLLIGLLLIVSRRKAVTQVLGYIVLENGIYAMGVALAGDVPLLVELGVLLDVFVGVFIMSIATYHISREFDHIDVDQLDRLRG